MTHDSGAPGPVRVVVADDDALVRAGIVALLTTADDIEVIAEADDGRAAIEVTERFTPDVLLLDIQMPRLDGIAALTEIASRHQGLPVAMLTTFSDEHFVASAIGAGARGFLLKSDPPRQLIDGVRALASDGGAFSPRIARWLAERERASSHRRDLSDDTLDKLTPQQVTLLSHLAQGRSNAQIARAMHLSVGTVKQYLSAVFTELGVDNRVSAALVAFRCGLVPED